MGFLGLCHNSIFLLFGVVLVYYETTLDYRSVVFFHAQAELLSDSKQDHNFMLSDLHRVIGPESPIIGRARLESRPVISTPRDHNTHNYRAHEI